MADQSTSPDDLQLLAYLRERDAQREKRRGRWITGAWIAGLLLVAGFVANNYMANVAEEKRESDQRVEDFFQAMRP